MDDVLGAILRQIILEPGVDLHRGVFADALDERGAPGDADRAAFIRRQLAVAATGDLFTEGATPKPNRAPLFLPGELTHEFHDQFIGKLHPQPWWSYTVFLGRGFADTWHVDGEPFLEHADTVIWRPGQVVACPNADCPVCGGAGSVPRPVPPTAHPIRKVRLTSRVPYFYRLPNGTWVTPHLHDPARFPRPSFFNRGSVVEGKDREHLEARFPGVAFELPTDVAPETEPAG